MRTTTALLSVIILLSVSSCGQSQQVSDTNDTVNSGNTMNHKVIKSETEWREELTPSQYHILREKGTERPYTGIYDDFFEAGSYHCAACDQALFDSDTKFNSGCGWPSFFAPLLENNVNINIDRSHGMLREEVTCSSCGGHLGHVFNDGPAPTHRRYCINSESLKFIPKKFTSE